MASTTKIVIGLDFGTTYSGVAWSMSTGTRDIEVLSTWPGGGNKTTPKAPTTVLYRDDDILWGYQTGHFGDVIRGVKLLLDESQELEFSPARRSSVLIKTKHKTPTEVAGDYLAKLVDLVEETLRRRYGGALEYMRFEYVLTVPAVWSDKAKDSTLEAAFKAGIAPADVCLVSEPEAAALYCMNIIQPNSIQDEDVILVCDAGGGTVDLISYCVKSVSPLKLVEATQGTGDVCGSTLLDVEFLNYLQEIFGDEYDSIPRRSIDLAMKYWEESVKPNFGDVEEEGDDDDDGDAYGEVDSFIPLPGVGNDIVPGMRDGFLIVSPDRIRDIFEPVIQRVENLIDSQIDDVTASGKTTKAILLVGGFGASEYLFQRLKKKHSSIVIMQPPNAWSAVARGAVMRGLEGNQIQKRIARRHYGIRFATRVRNISDLKDGDYWSDLEEVWKRGNQIKWYINKGDSIDEEKPIKMTWYRTYNAEDTDANPDLLRGTDSLYVCQEDEAPGELGDGVVSSCRLQFDLRRIPRCLFKKRCNSKGIGYYVVEFQISMKPTSASILFELLFDGRTYGAVHAEY